jgi:hypothetical protein
MLEAVRTFVDFDEGIDLTGEHKIASLAIDGNEYFFEIHYFDIDRRYLADDPSDPARTLRIMTIFCASEYSPCEQS